MSRVFRAPWCTSTTTTTTTNTDDDALARVSRAARALTRDAHALERAFSVANSAAVIGWSALVVSRFVKTFDDARVVRVIANALSIAYLFFLAACVSFEDVPEASFSSLAGVKALFTSDVAALAGWVHYLAFDLLIGARLAREERERGVPAWCTVCLTFPLTFLAGPVGFVSSAVLVKTFGR